MKDEKKMMNGEVTPFEEFLLRSAREETPSDEVSTKMLAPLMPAPVPPPADLATPTAGAATLKWGVALVGALSVVGGLTLMQAPDEPQRVDAPPSPVQTSHTEPVPKHESSKETAPEHAAAAETPSDAPSRPMERSKSTVGAAPVQRPAVTRSAPAAAGEKERASTLNAEMRLLDAARAALSQGNQDRALSLLSRYDQKYGNGLLRQEATVLRVSALKASGQGEQADDLKADFLSENPKSAHRKRLEDELGHDEGDGE